MYLSTHCTHWHTSFLTYLWCASVTPSLYTQLPDCSSRFSLVKGASTSKDKAKHQYYPISPSQRDVYDRGQDNVDLSDLPLHDQKHNWATIEKLNSAHTIDEQKRIMKSTGISQLTICSASPAFLHPSFFPLDPFHLFYENCMVHIWDTWVKFSVRGEKIHMRKEMAVKFGEEIEKAMDTLPPSFSLPI